MKHVVAVIRAAALTDIKVALDDEFPDLGMTTTWAEGYGRQKGHTEVYRGAEYAIDFVPKIRIDIICDDHETHNIIELVASVARTGTIGDGKIWVHPIDTQISIRHHHR